MWRYVIDQFREKDEIGYIIGTYWGSEKIVRISCNESLAISFIQMFANNSKVEWPKKVFNQESLDKLIQEYNAHKM